ncbi:hypothetical protein DRK59_24235 [Salmonella enterica subsp. diarizonae]|uniref:hypothetical protein n=1 Tax=Salmonella enterica TaxID=28901 RepID=UPI000FB9D280|nr:hypothetical protein [Salmonella enterica]ECE0111497.1 hypothetical protein [Salmonella enterica subsp. diarizonae]HCM1648860.1 hypothetical protein [Salmonella enterica subsp. diarizonae serovar 48:i:z35]ECC5184989.1 hypothetical protein [Salmonella enterica]ECC6253451.1 hypothetical protein [Salmonella enterica]
MYNYSEKRMIVFYRKKQIRILESLFDRLFENGKDPKFIGQQVSDIYIGHKNSKTRILLCKLLARMNPDDVKHTLLYLRYIHYDKGIDCTINERRCVAYLLAEILSSNNKNLGDYRESVIKPFTLSFEEFQKVIEDFRPQ